jgi:hypothetical protein
VKDITTLPHAEYIGRIAAFCLPRAKLDEPLPEYEGRTARKLLHAWLLRRHNGYTHEPGLIAGCWREGEGCPEDADAHERYEVAVRGEKGMGGLAKLVSTLCRLLGEQAIYLAVGGTAFLVRPGAWLDLDDDD